MKIPKNPYRCPLGRMQPTAPDTERIKREGWNEEHILVIAEHDSRLDAFEREIVRRIGERLYGDPTPGGRLREAGRDFKRK